MSIVQKTLSKQSPKYQEVKVDNELIISFGGLIVNWKPQCMINLVQFLNTQASDAKEQRYAATDNSMIDADQLRGSELIRAAEERYDQV